MGQASGAPVKEGFGLRGIQGFMYIGFIKDRFSGKLERDRGKQHKVGEGAEHEVDLS